jgi:uncharacterized protein YidB (DUF937 family)
MGLFDGVLGGVVGAVVTDVIRRNGGVQGVVNQFESQGFGPTVRSWVSTGPNQPIAPEHVEQVFGSDLLQQMSAKTGMSVTELKEKLAEILPQAIDQMTPGGMIPKS